MAVKPGLAWRFSFHPQDAEGRFCYLALWRGAPERQLKANTDKRRTYSLFRQGCMYYQAIPNMPEHRLRPLIERFAQLLGQQPLFRQTFGVI